MQLVRYKTCEALLRKMPILEMERRKSNEENKTKVNANINQVAVAPKFL